MTNHEKFKQAWNQNTIPALFRRERGHGHLLLVRLPYYEENRSWLRNNKHNIPTWKKKEKRWEVPMAWFNDLVERSLNRWGKVYIIQPYRHMEKCAPACMDAVGHECNCSCMGKDHGGQSSSGGWFIVSDTFAARWGEKEFACRLLTRSK